MSGSFHAAPVPPPSSEAGDGLGDQSLALYFQSQLPDLPERVLEDVWRSMPEVVLKQNLAIAMSAPVLPVDTAASARPSRTASSASHMLDFHRPLRSAWLGLASMATATSV